MIYEVQDGIRGLRDLFTEHILIFNENVYIIVSLVRVGFFASRQIHQCIYMTEFVKTLH